MKLEIFIKGLEDVYPALDSPRSGSSEKTLKNLNDKDYEKYQSFSCCKGCEGCDVLEKEFTTPYIMTETYDDSDDDVDDTTDSASVAMETPQGATETYNCIIWPYIRKPHRYKTKVSTIVCVVLHL